VAQAQRKQKSSTKQSKTPSGPSRLVRILREVGLIGLAAVSLFLLLSVVTFHQSDPGWSHAADVDVIENSGGIIGAWIANILLYVCGYIGYLFPFALAFSGWQLYLSSRRGEMPEPLHMSLAAIGFLLTLIGACGLAENHFDIGTGIPTETAGAGGILGDAAGSHLFTLLGPTGSALILLAMLLTGVTLYTGLSWFRVMDYTGHWTLAFIDWLQTKRDEYRDRAQGAKARHERETVMREVKQKTENRAPPKIEPVISNLETGTRSTRHNPPRAIIPRRPWKPCRGRSRSSCVISVWKWKSSPCIPGRWSRASNCNPHRV